VLQNDQREERESADDPDYDRIEPDDEKPAVVTLREGDLTAEEADELQRDLGMTYYQL
jgi:heat shock protein HspQ